MTLSASARTHAGRVRSQNEDAAVCRPEHGLFAVIDGMGGQEAGEVAAAIAAAAIAEVPNLPKLASETVLAAAMKEARRRILVQAEADPTQKDMGAVATAVRLDDNGRSIGVAHVGDTRAWLVGTGGLRQLTRDHVADGEPGGAGKRPVARDLGRRTMEGEWVETGRFPVSSGDLLVLASDGLHDAVPADELSGELSRLWREGVDADAVSARLVALALARGGPDNVTVIAVRIGTFRRGKRQRRLNRSLSVLIFLALASLAVFAVLGKRAPLDLQLPDRVDAEVRFASPTPVAVEAGKTTTVAAGARLDLRGVRVTGVDWRIEVGEGAVLSLDISAVQLAGAFTVLLAEGATFQATDTRVQAGSIRVVSSGTGNIALRHVTLMTTATEGPIFEGPVTPIEHDVRRGAESEIVPAADKPENTPPTAPEGEPETPAPSEAAPR